jgi:hypothetical protein
MIENNELTAVPSFLDARLSGVSSLPSPLFVVEVGVAGSGASISWVFSSDLVSRLGTEVGADDNGDADRAPIL